MDLGSKQNKNFTETKVKIKESEVDLPSRSNAVNDFCAAICFLTFVAFLLVVGIFAYKKSSAEILLDGIDSWGNLCGKSTNILPENIRSKNNIDKNNINKLFELHIPLAKIKENQNLLDIFHRGEDDLSICVEECPATTVSCKDLLVKNGYVNEKLIKSKICDVNSEIEPHLALGNKCIPKKLFTDEQSFVTGNVLHVIKSLLTFKDKILYFTLCSIGLSAALFCLLVVLPKFALLTQFIIVVFGTLAVCAYTWCKLIIKISVMAQKLSEAENEKTAVLSKSRYVHTHWRYSLFFAIVGFLLTLIIVAYLMLIWGKRKSVVGFFREASYVTLSLPSLFVLPLFAITIKFVVILHTLYMAFHILYLLEPVKWTIEPDLELIKWTWINEKFIIILLVFNFIGCYLVLQVLSGCFRTIVAGMISKWYFTSEKTTGYQSFTQCFKHLFNQFSFVYPTGLVLRYNFGSVCLGAVLIPPLQFGRLTLMSLNHSMMKRKFRILRFITGGFCGCLWWTQHVVQYVNHYMYMAIAIYGLSFWQSGKKASKLLNEISHVVPAKRAANRTLLIGKLGAMLFIGFVSTMFFKTANGQGFCPQNAAPILINSIIAYTIASSFLTVYRIVFDCLMICYAIDSTSNTGFFYGREEFLRLMTKKRSRRIGWSNKTLSIPMQETKDTRIYITPSRHNRIRPKAARGKRRPPTIFWIEGNQPHVSKSNESMSLDGPVETIVDRFDIFVDKMIYECEMSPLSKRRQFPEKEKNDKSSFPPINPTGIIEDPSSLKLKQSLVEDLKIIDLSDDEKEPNKISNKKNQDLLKPIKIDVPAITQSECQPQISINTISLQPFREHNLPGLVLDKQNSEKNIDENKLPEKKQFSKIRRPRVHFKDEVLQVKEPIESYDQKQANINPAEPLYVITKASELHQLKRSCLRKPFM